MRSAGQQQVTNAFVFSPGEDFISIGIKPTMVQVDPNIHEAMRHLHEGRILFGSMNTSANARIGEVIDRYRIEALLGEGGFGAVYRAKHVVMARNVALKLLHPGTDRDDDTRERFLREAQAAAAVGHRSIVQVFDCGITQDGKAFIAMEMLEGEDLEEYLKKHGPVSRERAVRLVIDLLDALEAAHQAGIVHRDLKPANVFLLENSDDLKILDFGISQMRGEGIRNLTQTGMVMGTPHYMAPETFRGVAKVDARADLYAVGAILYQLLSGQPPHDAQSYEQLVVRVATMPAPPIRQVLPDLPQGLAQLVDHALASNPDERWPNARAFREALLSFTAAPLDVTQQDDGRPPALTPAWGIGTPSPTAPVPGGPVLSTAPMPAVPDPLGATGLAAGPETARGAPLAASAHPPAYAQSGTIEAGSSAKRGLLIGGAILCSLLCICAGAFVGLRSQDDASAQAPAIPPGPVQPGPVQPGPVQPGPVQPGPVQPGPTAARAAPAPTSPTPALQNSQEITPDLVAENGPQEPSVGSPAPPSLAPPTSPAAPTISEVRVELVSALGAAAGPAVAFGDTARAHVGPCARAQPHVVLVQLMVSTGGQINIAQPDPTEEHGDDRVATCVANRMRAQGPVPNGEHGILTYRVELPGR